MQLVSAKSVRVTLYPPGPPEDKYGATFGSLRAVSPPVEEFAMGHPIEGEAHAEMQMIKDHMVQCYKDGGIICGATSGVELDPRSSFRGFHVGSFHNMIFKYALLLAGKEAGIPVVIFADEDKVPYEFKPDRCFPICDTELSWEDVCKRFPSQSPAPSAQRKARGKMMSLGSCTIVDLSIRNRSERVKFHGASLRATTNFGQHAVAGFLRATAIALSSSMYGGLSARKPWRGLVSLWGTRNGGSPFAGAQTLGVASQARADALAMATKLPGMASNILLRQCSVEPQERETPAREFTTEQRTWTRRSPARH